MVIIWLKAKLRALADFAEIYNNRFLRIQSVAEVEDGTLHCFDLLDETDSRFGKDDYRA